jgi:hypothetical protein
LLHGLSAADLQSRPGVPILLKKRHLISLNEIDTYLRQLRERVSGGSRADEEKR